MGQPPEDKETCQYRFEHRNRPREVCGLAANLPDERHCRCKERHCFWHCREIDKTARDQDEQRRIKGRLQQAVGYGHYLEGAWLPQAHLEGAWLEGAHLEGAWLWGAHLEGAGLPRAHLEGARLKGAHLERARLLGAHLEGAGLPRAHLEGAWLKEIHLSEETSCSNTRWGVCGEERDACWGPAASVYQTIWRHYAQVGDYARCDDFYFREMRMYHRNLLGDKVPDKIDAIGIDWSEGHWPAFKQACSEWCRWLKERYRKLTEPRAGRFLKRFWKRIRAIFKIIVFPVRNVLVRWCQRTSTRFIWGLHRLVWGYGVRPARTFGWMAAVIVFFTALFYWWLPVACPDNSVVVPCESPGGLGGLKVALTASLDAFTTVGYGGYRPGTDTGQLLAGVEGLLGVLLAAAFLVALATKYVRRG
jgi:hypothetical protein